MKGSNLDLTMDLHNTSPWTEPHQMQRRQATSSSTQIGYQCMQSRRAEIEAKCVSLISFNTTTGMWKVWVTLSLARFIHLLTLSVCARYHTRPATKDRVVGEVWSDTTETMLSSFSLTTGVTCLCRYRAIWTNIIVLRFDDKADMSVAIRSAIV